MTELLAVLAAALAVAFGVSRADARRAKSRAIAAETRAAMAEQQADALAAIELARTKARQVGHNELAKMRETLRGHGRRDQLAKP
ncbi:MAG TPA: hypothetical protein PKY50_06080 [Candidatus Competibacter sp.]|nr:hypothetical protein [Candidatus Competibacter sp.]